MTQPEIYDLLEEMFRPVDKRLDADGQVELDGLLDLASRRLACPCVSFKARAVTTLNVGVEPDRLYMRSVK